MQRGFLVFQGLCATTRFPWHWITFGIGDKFGWTGPGHGGTQGGVEGVDMDTNIDAGGGGHINTVGGGAGDVVHCIRNLNTGGTRHVSACCRPLPTLRFLSDWSRSPSPDCCCWSSRRVGRTHHCPHWRQTG